VCVSVHGKCQCKDRDWLECHHAGYANITCTQPEKNHADRGDQGLGVRGHARRLELAWSPIRQASQANLPDTRILQIEETSGWVCVGMRGEDLDRLELPLLVPQRDNDEAMCTAFAMPVDLAAGTTTGIDAHDRWAP